MKQTRIIQGLAALATALALAAAPAAWAYDSAINAGIGQYTLDYQDQAQSVKGTTAGWRLGYVGRFNENLGFDVRMGGAGKTNAAGLTLQPGFFLSLLFRPSITVGDAVDFHGLIGLTSLAIGRTPALGTEEIIARVGGSFGLGADYRINNHMAVGIEWVSYQHNVDYGPKSNSSNWTGVNQANVSLSSLTANFKYQF